jgi:hypothetical protein
MLGRIVFGAALMLACGGLTESEEDEPGPKPESRPADVPTVEPAPEPVATQPVPETTSPPSRPPVPTAVCSPDHRRCNGQLREVCDDGQWRLIEDCGDQYVCDPTHCAPQPRPKPRQ